MNRRGARTLRRLPGNRAVERPIDLEDAGAIAESAEAPNVSRRELVARDLVVEVAERIGAHHEVVLPLAEHEVARVAREVARLDVEAVAICLRMIREYDSGEAWTFLAVLVPLLISLTVENFLADSASPGGVAYNLALSSMLACGALYPKTAPATSPATVHVLTLQPTGTPGAWSTSG